MPTKKEIDAVWDKTKKVRGEDPNKVRQDPYGNRIRYDKFGQETSQGWEIDHIKPSSRGGSDSIRNLQALQTKKNRERGDALVKKSRHNQR